MAAFQDRVDRALADPPAAPTPIEELGRRAHRRRRRRVTVLAIVLAVGILGCTGGLIAVSDGGSRVGVVARGGSSWQLLAPEAGVQGPGVWTGHEVPFDGKAFNPATSAWTTLAPAPAGSFANPNSALGVWTGTEMILWESPAPPGSPPSSFDAMAFNPAANTWRPLARSPLYGEAQEAAVWTGSALIAFGASLPMGGRLDGAIYDPAQDSWRRLPATPFGCALRPLAAWTGTGVVVLCDNSAGVGRSASYAPTTDTWTALPDPAQSVGDNGSAFWTGRVLMVWTEAGGQIYDPARGSWQLLPPAPLSQRADASVAWTGRRLIVWGGFLDGPAQARVSSIADKYLADGAAYDPGTKSWAVLPPVRLIGRCGATAVWTGNTLFLWGGRGYGVLDPLGSGALFTPGRPSSGS